MDVAVFAIVLLALAAFVAAPLYARSTSRPLEDEEPAPDTTVLSDLEVDRESGLIDPTDYERERAAFRADRD